MISHCFFWEDRLALQPQEGDVYPRSTPGTGVLLVLTFLTSAVANRVANRILLARHSKAETLGLLWDIGGFLIFLRYPVSVSISIPSHGFPWYPPQIWLKQVPMAKHSLFLSLATSAAQFPPQSGRRGQDWQHQHRLAAGWPPICCCY